MFTWHLPDHHLTIIWPSPDPYLTLISSFQLNKSYLVVVVDQHTTDPISGSSFDFTFHIWPQAWQKFLVPILDLILEWGFRWNLDSGFLIHIGWILCHNISYQVLCLPGFKQFTHYCTKCQAFLGKGKPSHSMGHIAFIVILGLIPVVALLIILYS